MSSSRLPFSHSNSDETNSNESDSGRDFGPFSQPSETLSVADPFVNSISTPFSFELQTAIDRTCSFFFEQQADEGYWVGELEGDTILESEYLLLLTWLERENSEEARLCANYILQQQLPEGGWAIYPGGPLEISASVKAYFALKITGHDPAADYMQRAKTAILNAGGVEKVNSFTRYYLALLGIIGYHQCPAVPPELMLIPKWAPFNIYEMSSWSRTIIIPLSILWAYQPVRQLPAEFHIDELFCNSPAELPITMEKCEALDDLSKPTFIDWEKVFRGVDRSWKLVEKARLRPLRKLAVSKAKNWMLSRFQESDGLGAIFPPIIWSIVALKCLGYPEESAEVQSQLNELEKLSIREADTIRLQPCKSPVWDTAIATIALREAGVSEEHPVLRKSVNWLLSKEVKQKGDWAKRNPGLEPGGWFFEFRNEFYPDVDDTIMVSMALRKCLPHADDRRWSTEFLMEDGIEKIELNTVTTGRHHSPQLAVQELERAEEMLQSIRRAIRWIMAMQCKNGGWGAFDRDNTRELFTQVPFADHNAMIDPPTGDITARTLEMFGCLDIGVDHAAIQRGLQFVWNDQEEDGSWYGRWGVHYIYGTWQCLVGLEAMGVPATDPRIEKGADWLEACQQESGGWGETPAAYDDPDLRGQGPVTPSQTAWALMGLMAAGKVESEAVTRGIEYLLSTQQEDGTWQEDWYTGTGFPKVFYLKYHYYCLYFPLMALGRYARLMSQTERAAS